MALVIPWLLVREYQQHRNALADQLSRVTGWAGCGGRYPPWRTRRVGAAAGTGSERSGALTVEWRFRPIMSAMPWGTTA